MPLLACLLLTLSRFLFCRKIHGTACVTCLCCSIPTNRCQEEVSRWVRIIVAVLDTIGVQSLPCQKKRLSERLLLIVRSAVYHLFAVLAAALDFFSVYTARAFDSTYIVRVRFLCSSSKECGLSTYSRERILPTRQFQYFFFLAFNAAMIEGREGGRGGLERAFEVSAATEGREQIKGKEINSATYGTYNKQCYA